MPMDWGLARDYAARDGAAEDVPVTEAEWLDAPIPIRCCGAYELKEPVCDMC
jgi:hypothetical protein